MDRIDLLDFYKSIGSELTAVKNRVRHLIGRRHWGKEGEYKEAILRNVIRRFLPKNYSIGTGFVAAHDGEINYITSQIDIIIYDNTNPTLFQEGDFIIVTPQAVRAVIEVKTQIYSSKFEKIVRRIIEDARLIRHNQGKIYECNPVGIPEEKPQGLFIGLFSYGTTKKVNFLYETIKEIGIKEKNKNIKLPLERYFINNIVLSSDYYISFKEHKESDYMLTLYNMKNLSYPNFITNILRNLSFLPVYMAPGVWVPFNEDQFINREESV